MNVTANRVKSELYPHKRDNFIKNEQEISHLTSVELNTLVKEPYQLRPTLSPVVLNSLVARLPSSFNTRSSGSRDNAVLLALPAHRHLSRGRPYSIEVLIVEVPRETRESAHDADFEDNLVA